MALFKLSESNLTTIEETSFQKEKIQEATLREAIRKMPVILREELLIVAEEYSNWEDSGRRIDVLAIDKGGNLVVVELKRTEDGGHAELQAIRYAAMVNSMTFENVVTAFQRHLQKIGHIEKAPSAEEMIRTFVLPSVDREGEGSMPTVLSGEVRIILVAREFSREVTASVLWLRDYGLDIRCLRLVPYRMGTDLLIHVDTVLPMPEARDYLVRVAEKQEQVREANAQTLKRYILTENGQDVPVTSRRRLFWEIVARLIRNGAQPDELATLLIYRNMFVVIKRADASEQSVKDAILRKYPDDEFCLGRHDWHGDQWIPVGDMVYVLKNQGSSGHLPKLEDRARSTNITWREA